MPLLHQNGNTSPNHFSHQIFNHNSFLFSLKPKFKTKWKVSILGFFFRCNGNISDAWCTTQWETKTVRRRWRLIWILTKNCESDSKKWKWKLWNKFKTKNDESNSRPKIVKYDSWKFTILLNYSLSANHVFIDIRNQK